jgi:hypothetical protein
VQQPTATVALLNTQHHDKSIEVRGERPREPSQKNPKHEPTGNSGTRKAAGESSRYHRPVPRAIAPAALLLAYACAFAAAALGGSLLVFDDHPGQYFRLWHGLTRGLAPWTWNPDWWTGYAELQYYPPGYVYLGALLHHLALGQLDPTLVYTALLWIIYALPGLTVFLLLVRLLPNPWLALPGAFLALTLSADSLSGVDGGVRTGMIAARLGWALLPAFVLSLIDWVRRGDRWPWGAPPLLAAIVLSHPAHAPAAVLALALAVPLDRSGRRRRVGVALGVVGMAALLTAFWTLPLLARLDGARALAWGEFSWRTLLTTLLRPSLLVPVAFAVAYPFVSRDRPRRVVGALPVAMLGLIAIDVSTWIPRDRLVDSFLLSVIVAGGAGLGLVLDRVAGGVAPRWLTAVVGVAALAALSTLDPGTLTLWPRAGGWPKLEETARGLRLPALWSALKAAPPGRVLFVRSAVPLVYGTEWYRPHTHITAMAPLYSGRAIVHGTFTHPSPIAALVYTGSAGPGAIRMLTERLDGHSLFGRPLGDLDTGAVDRMTAALGVTAVVLLDDDRGRFPALEHNAAFTSSVTPPFVVYARRSAVTLPTPVAAGRWQFQSSGGGPGWVPARVAYSPLWRAEQNGRALRCRRGHEGELEVEITGPAVIELIYGAGVWEHAGVVLTALAGAGFGAALIWSVIPGRRREPRPAE